MLVERVHSMPKQGVSSSFKFGENFGWFQGLLQGLGIPYTLVSPSVWQKAMECRSGGDKNVTKVRATQLFPEEKIYHWNADGLLLAELCRRKVEGGRL